MPAEVSGTRRQLGELLKARRKAFGLNTRDTGRLIGRSHTHVARIERAEAPISLPEARRWIEATETASRDALVIEALVEAAAAESTPWRLDRGADLQEQAAARIERASVVESFVWHIVPGLLQTPEYCRRAADRFGVIDLDEYVAARVRRQAVLDEPGRTFRFVIRAEVLHQADAAQRSHIHDVDRKLDTVTVRVIDDLDLPMRATCSLDLHSDAAGPIRVGIELPHGGLELTDPTDLAVYRALYDDLITASRPLFEWDAEGYRPTSRGSRS